MNEIRKILVFVYGTLRKHERNHWLLKDSSPVSMQCWTHGKLYDTELGYPALVEDSGRVYGELYEVTEETLEKLDILEGFTGTDGPNYYKRIVQQVNTDDLRTDALMYVMQPNEVSHMRLIPMGDWRCDRILKSEQNFLYLAYGSCMDNERFINAEVEKHFQDVAGRGVLNGFGLRFTRSGGYADIVETSGEIVEGKVYRISSDTLNYLYRREGVHVGAYRPVLLDVNIHGIDIEDVLSFTVVEKLPETAPPNEYVNEIIRGGEGVLSDHYLSQLITHINELHGGCVIAEKQENESSNWNTGGTLNPYYHKMWMQDRWKFTEILFEFMFQEKLGQTDPVSQERLNAMTEIIREYEGQWLSTYNWLNDLLRKKNYKKRFENILRLLNELSAV